MKTQNSDKLNFTKNTALELNDSKLKEIQGEGLRWFVLRYRQLCVWLHILPYKAQDKLDYKKCRSRIECFSTFRSL